MSSHENPCKVRATPDTADAPTSLGFLNGRRCLCGEGLGRARECAGEVSADGAFFLRTT